MNLNYITKNLNKSDWSIIIQEYFNVHYHKNIDNLSIIQTRFIQFFNYFHRQNIKPKIWKSYFWQLILWSNNTHIRIFTIVCIFNQQLQRIHHTNCPNPIMKYTCTQQISIAQTNSNPFIWIAFNSDDPTILFLRLQHCTIGFFPGLLLISRPLSPPDQTSR